MDVLLERNPFFMSQLSSDTEQTEMHELLGREINTSSPRFNLLIFRENVRRKKHVPLLKVKVVHLHLILMTRHNYISFAIL